MKLHRKFSKPFFTNCYFETRGRKFQFDSRKLLYRLSYVKLLSFNSQTYKGVFEVLARRKIGGASTKGSRSCNQNTKRYMSIWRSNLSLLWRDLHLFSAYCQPLHLLSFEFSCSCFTPFHTSQCICIKQWALQTRWQNSQTFYFLFEVVRGFLARRRCKRLREEAIMNARKAATFLQYSSVCGNKLFLSQEELLQHDYKKKEGITIITVIQKSYFI